MRKNNWFVVRRKGIFKEIFFYVKHNCLIVLKDIYGSFNEQLLLEAIASVLTDTIFLA